MIFDPYFDIDPEAVSSAEAKQFGNSRHEHAAWGRAAEGTILKYAGKDLAELDLRVLSVEDSKPLIPSEFSCFLKNEFLQDGFVFHGSEFVAPIDAKLLFNPYARIPLTEVPTFNNCLKKGIPYFLALGQCLDPKEDYRGKYLGLVDLVAIKNNNPLAIEDEEFEDGTRFKKFYLVDDRPLYLQWEHKACIRSLEVEVANQ